jgi:TonB-linked SusC/RagA family outer membrane protein
VYAYYTRYFNSVWTNTLDYHFNILKNGDLYMNAQVGYESQSSKGYLTSTQARGLPLNPLLNVAAVGATPQTASATISEYTFISEFSSANLNFKDRYVVSGSYRRDGSSRFGVNNKYGNFWSIGGSWNISNESFMENVHVIDQFKLRASYGVNGNAGIGNYDWFPGYGFGNNYNNSPGSAPNNVGNLDLTWELNKPFNFGIDLSILKNRLNISADYYTRKSTDLLLGVPLSRTSGFASANRNIGSLENKGFELAINAVPVQGKDFNWTIDFNFANNKNRIISLPGGKDIANGSFLIRQGYDIQSFYARVYSGADPANGDPLWFLDSTNKTTTNNYSLAQRIMYGSASPKYFGSFTNSLRFKGFSVEAQLYYSFGNYVQDPWAIYYLGAGFGPTFNKVARVMDRWQKPGDVTDVPKYIYNGNKSFNSFSTFYLAKGDFIRLRNIQIGFDLPKGLLSKANIGSAFFYIRGTNLWTWVKDDKLPFDPEQGVASQSNLDVFIPKTVTFGLNLSF